MQLKESGGGGQADAWTAPVRLWRRDTIRLYLVQHGEAIREDEDPERPLTERGLSDVHRVARVAAQAGAVTVARILHSGKTRARQTAEIWAEALGVPVDEAEGLAPLDDPSIWAERVRALRANVMLVGHLPHLAKLAGLLLVGDAEQGVVAFQQGGIVGLEHDGAVWSALLVLPPAAAPPIT